jgi:hypothetical protein
MHLIGEWQILINVLQTWLYSGLFAYINKKNYCVIKLPTLRAQGILAALTAASAHDDSATQTQEIRPAD